MLIFLSTSTVIIEVIGWYFKFLQIGIKKMSWFEILVLVFIVWGGSSFALSLSQLKKDVEHIKSILIREEIARENLQSN